MAKHMLRVKAEGLTLPTHYEAPVAMWKLGGILRIAALPGEPVAEFVPLLREAIGPEHLWISGYNNDCFGYLPTARVVREGGHEAIGVTLWLWGQDLRTSVGF